MKFRKVLVLALALLSLGVYAFAQAPVPPEPTATFDLTYVVGGIGAVLIYIVTFYIKKLAPTLPKLVVLAIPIVLGGLGTFVLAQQAHQVAGSVQYLALGTLAVLIDNVIKYART